MNSDFGNPAAKVCVLGSANLDFVALVDRPPRLGETVTGHRLLQVPGGKGANQALAAARAGAAVRMLGAVGADLFGARIREALDHDGVDTSGLLATDVETGTAHIVVDSAGRNTIVVVPGANGSVGRLTDDQREAIASSDVLLLQLELPLPPVIDAAAWARRSGTTVLLTPAPVVALPDELLTVVDLLVPNELEAAQLTGDTDPLAAGRLLLQRGVGGVIVTLGERGCIYVADGASQHVPAPAVEAVDTTAAGDTFVGSLAVALAEQRPLDEALAWATAAAALSVQRVGASASMPYRADIESQASELR